MKFKDIFSAAQLIINRQKIFFNIFISVIALLTCYSLWLSSGRTFSAQSLMQLWLAQHLPNNIFQWLLHPIAANDNCVALLLSFINSAILLLLVNISLSLGVSPLNSFAMFLLLNFNPEVNDVRLNVDAAQIAILLWLLSLWLFLVYYQRHFYRAWLLWALLLLIATFFNSFAILWLLFFPLTFLLWTIEQQYWRTIKKRLIFIIGYLLLAAIIIIAIPILRQLFFNFIFDAQYRIAAVIEKISFFIGEGRGVELSLLNAFFIALTVTAINIFKIAGIPIIFVSWISLRRFARSILSATTRSILIAALLFSWCYAALFLLYSGHFGSDLLYLPTITIMLLLSSGGIFYVIVKFKDMALRVEHRLVLFWLLVAYALASVIQFGPSQTYKKNVGNWVKAQQYQNVYSNDASALYYANKSPFAVDAQLSLNNKNYFWHELLSGDIYIYIKNRHQRQWLPTDSFYIDATFGNRHGDKAYVLRKL